MAKTASYVCQSCGATHAKWSGKCEACNAWNTIVEEGVAPPLGSGASRRVKGRAITLEDLKTEDAPPQRRPTGINEFDRVTGGGLVPGSALLVGGDPGIGKSTIILQALGKYAQNGGHAIYISGEEAMAQVRMRAARMGLADAPLMLGAATCVEDILATLEKGKPPAIIAIDSIQTLWTGALDAAPGTIAQVRTASFDLVRYAKASGAALILVGHVTKDGQIAGPKAVEHLVDAVLYFEGERGHHFRVLRATKNRFGATDEIGVFEMTEGGLVEVPNPSALFLAERRGNVSGSAVFAGIEGTRPVLVEVQALLAPSAGGSPRRQVVGWDSGRLAMLMAVLEARCGMTLGMNDVYLNIAGGLRIAEPAADLAVAAALASAATDRPTDPGMVYFGEIGLSGEIRQVAQAEARLREAQKLGFSAATLPRRAARGGRPPAALEGFGLSEIGHVADLVAAFAAKPRRQAG